MELFKMEAESALRIQPLIMCVDSFFLFLPQVPYVSQDTQGVCDSVPVNDRKVHALHSACPCWYGRWIGFLGREGAASFGTEGHRWQLIVHRGLPRAVALSTYCVLLTGPWCHHGPLALTACHHVTVGLMVKQCKVRTVNTQKKSTFKNRDIFSYYIFYCMFFFIAFYNTI